VIGCCGGVFFFFFQTVGPKVEGIQVSPFSHMTDKTVESPFVPLQVNLQIFQAPVNVGLNFVQEDFCFQEFRIVGLFSFLKQAAHRLLLVMTVSPNMKYWQKSILAFEATKRLYQ
jgi:hypothetical protein